MGARTVRLDDEAENTLEQLRSITGLSISQVVKEGLTALETQALQHAKRKPCDIYRELELGEGGNARAPAGQTVTRRCCTCDNNLRAG